MPTFSDVTKFLRQIKSEGWNHESTSNGHIKLTHPNASGAVIMGSTPGDWRFEKNVRREMRRVLPSEFKPKIVDTVRPLHANKPKPAPSTKQERFLMPAERVAEMRKRLGLPPKRHETEVVVEQPIDRAALLRAWELGILRARTGGADWSAISAMRARVRADDTFRDQLLTSSASTADDVLQRLRGELRGRGRGEMSWRRRLVDLRKALGCSVAALAHQLKISPAVVSQIERAADDPSPAVMLRIEGLEHAYVEGFCVEEGPEAPLYDDVPAPVVEVVEAEPVVEAVEPAPVPDFDVREWMRAGRERIGLSQRQLAQRLGVHYMTVTKWELKQQTPYDKHIATMREMFGAPLPSLPEGVAMPSKPKTNNGARGRRPVGYGAKRAIAKDQGILFNAARNELELTQVALGKLLGISGVMVGHYEREEVGAPLEVMAELEGLMAERASKPAEPEPAPEPEPTPESVAAPKPAEVVSLPSAARVVNSEALAWELIACGWGVSGEPAGLGDQPDVDDALVMRDIMGQAQHRAGAELLLAVAPAPARLRA